MSAKKTPATKVKKTQQMSAAAIARGDKHTRKQSNVRLSDAGRSIIASAVTWLGVSQSAVIELALRELARAQGFELKAASRPQSSLLLEESGAPSAPQRLSVR